MGGARDAAACGGAPAATATGGADRIAPTGGACAATPGDAGAHAAHHGGGDAGWRPRRGATAATTGAYETPSARVFVRGDRSGCSVVHHRRGCGRGGAVDGRRHRSAAGGVCGGATHVGGRTGSATTGAGAAGGTGTPPGGQAGGETAAGGGGAPGAAHRATHPATARMAVSGECGGVGRADRPHPRPGRGAHRRVVRDGGGVRAPAAADRAVATAAGVGRVEFAGAHRAGAATARRYGAPTAHVDLAHEPRVWSAVSAPRLRRRYRAGRRGGARLAAGAPGGEHPGQVPRRGAAAGAVGRASLRRRENGRHHAVPVRHAGHGARRLSRRGRDESGHGPAQ
eukprot:ctg_2535.g447